MNLLGFSPSPLTLGTVQLGLPYGVGNRDSTPSPAEAGAILDLAAQGGVRVIDTARAYGNSEASIGAWLKARRAEDMRIVTKVPALGTGPARERKAALQDHLAASLSALGRDRLDLVLVHRETDLLDPMVVDTFQEAVRDAAIGAFGASLYRPAVGLELLERVPLAAIQLPANLLDRRFEQAGVFAKAKARGVAVFVRSVFLQGALLIEPDRLPPHLDALRKPVAIIRDFAIRQNRSLGEILILAARDIPGATSLVIGVNRAEQLVPHLSAIAAPAVNSGMLESLRDEIGVVPDTAIDPTAWRR